MKHKTLMSYKANLFGGSKQMKRRIFESTSGKTAEEKKRKGTTEKSSNYK